MVFWPPGEDGGIQAAAGSEFALDDAPDRISGFDDVAEHFVYGIFVKNAQIAKSEDVVLQGLEFHTQLVGHVFDGYHPKVRELGFWTN